MILLPVTDLNPCGRLIVTPTHRTAGKAMQNMARQLPSVEDRRLYSGVAANEQDGVSLLHAHERSVHDVVAAHICIKVREAALAVQVATAHPVHQILQCNAKS